MTAREKLLEFLASNADMLTPNQAARVDALREKQAQRGALGVDVGSAPECCYCGIKGHDGDNCPTTFTPIRDCEHKDADDGCCHHPKNMTPECHVGACPRLHRRIYDAWHASLPNNPVTDAEATP